MTLSRFKLAAKKDDENKVLARNALMVGAAAAPFAGLIGQKPILHEFKGPEFNSLEQLKKVVKPGDIVLSSSNKKGLVNTLVMMGTGTPTVTHAAFVDDKKRLISTLNTAPKHGPSIEKWNPKRTYTVVRPHERFKPHILAKKYRAQFDAATDVEKTLKEFKLSPEQLTEVRKQFYASPGQMAASAAREIYFPKILPAGSLKKKFRDFIKRPSPEAICDAASGWCTLPGASSLPEVVPGKAMHDITPTDFLRSRNVKAVGGYARTNGPLNRLLKAGPTITRLGLGALGAAAVYGLANQLMKKRSDKHKPNR